MANKKAVSLLNQDAFFVEADCRTALMDYEEWDSAEKIVSVLWKNAALMGEFAFSDELKQEIINKSSFLFQKILKNPKAPLSDIEQRILVLGAITLTQEFDIQEEESQLWHYIFNNLGYSENAPGAPAFQSVYLRYRAILRNTIATGNHYFADEGQKYYNTLRIHALSPMWSVDHLLNILYAFYAKNLESQYIEYDGSFNLLVQNISARWEDQNESESELKLRSDTLASSFKILFKSRPQYMAAVCDALVQKIDAVLKGNSNSLDMSNRWDVALKKWFDNKTQHEQTQMINERKRASKERVATRKEDIRPQYHLIDDDIYLNIPRIRLPEITMQPVLQLLQNDHIVDQVKLSVFGDDLCLTAREYQFALSYISEIDWTQPLNFAIKIICDNAEIYNSESTLFRKCLLFHPEGHEVNECKKWLPTHYLFTDEYARVEIIPEDNVYQIGRVGQLFRIDMLDLQSLVVNGVDLLAENSKNERAFYYLSEKSKENVRIKSGDTYYEVFSKPVTANIILPKGDQAQNYYLHIDSAKRSLYEYDVVDGKIHVPLPRAARYCHSVTLRDFQSGKLVFNIAYIIIPDFSYDFNEPLYINKGGSGSVKVKASGNTKRIDFDIEQDQSEICFTLWANTDCYLKIPKLEATLSGQNAFLLPEKCWHEAIRLGDFVRLSYPVNCDVSLFLGGKEVPAIKKGKHYDLGNYIHSQNKWDLSELPLGLIVRFSKEKPDSILLTNVVFQEGFSASPIKLSDRVIEWDVEAFYVGPDTSEFKVLLENDEGEPWYYRTDLRKRKLEKNFPCREGIYHYQVFLRGKEQLFTKTPDRLIYEGDITVGDPHVARFYGRELRLRKVRYWPNSSTQELEAPIRDGDGILTDLEYRGISSIAGVDGEYPEYEATLNYVTYNGRWYQFNYREGSEKYLLINPVSVWVLDDHRLVIQTCEGEALLINSKRPADIKTVRLVNSLAGISEEDQRKYVSDTDYFEYEETPETERY